MIPDAVAAFAAHTKAVGRLFQTYSPDTFKHGYSHRLFVGFRPLLVCVSYLISIHNAAD
jgi:hypothetical protein